MILLPVLLEPALAADYTCPGDFSGLNEAMRTLAGVAGPNTLSFERADCVPTQAELITGVDVDITCNVGSGCPMPPLRVEGGGHLGLSGFSFGAVRAFAMDAADDNRELFPGYDAVTTSLYVDGVDLAVHDTEFDAGEASFGAIVAVDADVSLLNVTVDRPAGHALKLLADDADVAFDLQFLTVSGAGDSAIRAVDNDEGYGLGQITDLSLSNAEFSGNQALYGPDLEVFVSGRVSVSNSTFTDSESYGAGAPVEVFASEVTFDTVTFTESQGLTATAMFLGGNLVTLANVRVSTTTPAERVAYINAIDELLVTDSALELDGRFEVYGGHAEFERNSFLVPTGAGWDSGVRLLVDSADFSRNFFCGGGVLANERGLVSGPVDLFFEENVFHGLNLAGPLIDTVPDEAWVGDPPSVGLVDNTIVDVTAANLLAGEIGSLRFANNLVAWSTATFDTSGWPDSYEADYNSWSFEDGSAPARPSGWGGNDLDVDDPGLVETYDPRVCGSIPALGAGSPEIDRGDPRRFSGDGSRSDIGAVDFGDEGEWGGTTDSGDTDTASTDTAGSDTATFADTDDDGWTDADDCEPRNADVHPNAVEIADDNVDQDCDGFDGQTSWSGGCGCSGAGPGAAAGLPLAVAALAWRRRKQG